MIISTLCIFNRFRKFYSLTMAAPDDDYNAIPDLEPELEQGYVMF